MNILLENLMDAVNAGNLPTVNEILQEIDDQIPDTTLGSLVETATSRGFSDVVDTLLLKAKTPNDIKLIQKAIEAAVDANQFGVLEKLVGSLKPDAQTGEMAQKWQSVVAAYRGEETTITFIDTVKTTSDDKQLPIWLLKAAAYGKHEALFTQLWQKRDETLDVKGVLAAAAASGCVSIVFSFR